ncbi:UDP-2,3-diacylglucosamine diphosphatase [Duganella sp. FT135W]|uniref:UDP-2,3-diacylglucosamine hydrolase n=1 Tax=Duganella flavida TaxID=2692175 RepID=A0A6L8KC37_9BURK|nr:UDP-2,3-diacylglucosamine diphosphatase [Duganella flavida]MYM24976.1 UDP-2,3-diacylglucosamine diphosphatase [Duganella flavida]
MSEVCALFISDLHLQPAHPATSKAFFDFLEQHARHAQQLYLLGDLFEYWAGDDDITDPYHADIVAALRAVSDAGVVIYWIAGNRDFLVGARFAEEANVILLPETWVAEIGGHKVVVLHGDAQCTQDTKYMEFRAMVRQPAWQAQFTAMPLAQRKAIIAGLRADSRKEQSGKSYDIMDVTPQAILDVFAETGAEVMIHGHTHRPALHQLDEGKRRYVLPDWEPESTPARGGWIAITDDGAITRYDLNGAVIPS